MLSERVFVLKSVRLYFEKTGRMRFISHLDMTRFLSRAIARAGLPIWHTEGFNPHPYITFALPLSLGHESVCEIAELRLLDDTLDIKALPERLNAVCPEYIRFFDCKEAVQKMKNIGFAKYEITFDDGGSLKNELASFLKSESILCEKKTKKGNLKQLDLVPLIKASTVTESDDGTTLFITLPAGSVTNINPELLLNAFFENSSSYACFRILRRKILNENGEIFE